MEGVIGDLKGKGEREREFLIQELEKIENRLRNMDMELMELRYHVNEVRLKYTKGNSIDKWMGLIMLNLTAINDLITNTKKLVGNVIHLVWGK